MRYVLAVTAILLLVASSASASSVTAEFYDVDPGINVYVNDPGVGVNNEYTTAGVYNFINVVIPPKPYPSWPDGSVGDAAHPLRMFCIDVVRNVSGGTTYNNGWTLGGLGSPPISMNANQVSDIQKLFGTYYNNATLTSATQSAAFQAALWEIVWETNGTLNVSGGNFSVNGGTNPTLMAAWDGSAEGSTADIANDMLESLATATLTQGVDVWVSDGVQNQVMVVSTGKDIPPVPEPLTMAGLGMGICGLVTYIRKRRS